MKKKKTKKKLTLKVNLSIPIFCFHHIYYFVLSSEFNACLEQIKVILSTVKKNCNFSPVTNAIYVFFTVSYRGCFENLGHSLGHTDIK